MEPNVQLCLTSDDLPAPPPLLVEALPEEAVATVLDRLGRLMARAVRPHPAAQTAKEGDDE